MVSAKHQALFAERVHAGLAALRTRYMEALDAGTKLPRLSKLSFFKAYGISKASLYKDHKSLLHRIEQTFSELQLLTEEASKNKRKPSIHALQTEVAALRKELRLQIATVPSISLTSFLETCGPDLRDFQNLLQEKQELMRENDRLRKTVLNQAEALRIRMLGEQG